MRGRNREAGHAVPIEPQIVKFYRANTMHRWKASAPAVIRYRQGHSARTVQAPVSLIALLDRKKMRVSNSSSRNADSGVG
jgi:hypothetical protein